MNVSDSRSIVSKNESGSQLEKRKEVLRALIEKCFLNTECKIVLVNKFTVGSFFNYKDKLTAVMSASLVYKLSCA